MPSFNYFKIKPEELNSFDLEELELFIKRMENKTRKVNWPYRIMNNAGAHKEMKNYKKLLSVAKDLHGKRKDNNSD